MKVKIWPFRRFVQIFIIIALFAFPIISRYSHYLTARQLDKLTEKWDGTFQGKRCQDGVYAYVLKYKSCANKHNTELISGHVSLLR